MDMVALQWLARFFRGIGRPCEVSRTITAIVDDRLQRLGQLAARPVDGPERNTLQSEAGYHVRDVGSFSPEAGMERLDARRLKPTPICGTRGDIYGRK
jgi:hypothetical protein